MDHRLSIVKEAGRVYFTGSRVHEHDNGEVGCHDDDDGACAVNAREIISHSSLSLLCCDVKAFLAVG